MKISPQHNLPPLKSYAAVNDNTRVHPLSIACVTACLVLFGAGLFTVLKIWMA